MLKLPKINSKEAKNEIVNFIQKTVSDANAKGIVVGLSGGIDSSVSGLLAVESLGKENVLGIHMYSSTTPEEDRKHARLMANLLDIKYIEVSIDTISEEFSLVTDIKNMTTLENTDQDTIKIANGNLKARIRMSLLYYYANLKNYIVIGTGNRSELLIGYFTKYGDGGCDIEPIGDIYKTQLRLLAKDWGIPEDIISKPPRAGLWPNQSDEDEIGLSYEKLDSLLYMIIDKNMNNEDIIENIDLSLEEIDRIRSKITNSRHKVKVPLSPKDCGKSF
ncbi:MAG: NAD+ synthase [Methanobacteriaceae archaeon]|mgnify:FL=1|nr:NAD+ synthase [Methanobacteriaceae archaeon]